MSEIAQMFEQEYGVFWGVGELWGFFYYFFGILDVSVWPLPPLKKQLIYIM